MAYETEIDGAADAIREAGTTGTIYTSADEAIYDAEVGDIVLDGVKIDEAAGGNLRATASPEAFEITSGDFAAAGFAAGQQVKLRLGSGALLNRGPFTVEAVSALSLSLSGGVEAMAAQSTWTLYAVGGDASEAITFVLTDPAGLRELQFQNGELSRVEYIGLLIAAKGLSVSVEPGSRVETASGDAYRIVDATSVRPDGTPILWKALARRVAAP